MRLATIRNSRSFAPLIRSIWQRHRRLWVAAAAIIAGVVLYIGVAAFVAYTADAYVWSDLVSIAPEVAGVVKAVWVADNQKVAAPAI
jgi:multidrug resistance efflux pump